MCGNTLMLSMPRILPLLRRVTHDRDRGKLVLGAVLKYVQTACACKPLHFPPAFCELVQDTASYETVVRLMLCKHCTRISPWRACTRKMCQKMSHVAS